MRSVAQVCLGLAALCFVMAIIFALGRLDVLAVTAEGLSRACTNLALLGIGFILWDTKKDSAA
jgi:hypothetical protein